MKISNEPLIPGSPVQFVLTGFPVDEAIASSIERFYAHAGDQADRNFFIYNAFQEQIFSGNVDGTGRVQELSVSDRQKRTETKLE